MPHVQPIMPNTLEGSACHSFMKVDLLTFALFDWAIGAGTNSTAGQSLATVRAGFRRSKAVVISCAASVSFSDNTFKSKGLLCWLSLQHSRSFNENVASFVSVALLTASSVVDHYANFWLLQSFVHTSRTASKAKWNWKRMFVMHGESRAS